MKNIPLVIVCVLSYISQANAQSHQSIQNQQTKEISFSKETTITNSNPNTKDQNTALNPSKKNANNRLHKKKQYTFVRSNNIYPNPATDYVKIKSTPESTVKIYNKDGDTIKEFTNTFGESFVDLRDVKKGTFYIDIKAPDDTIVTEKLRVKN